MSTFPSIRHKTCLVPVGMWHTPSYVRPTAIREAGKAQETGLSSRSASVGQLYEDPFLGSNAGAGHARPVVVSSGRARRSRRAMWRTYVILAFGLGLSACNTVPTATALKAPATLEGQACRHVPAGEHRAWSNCMIGVAPKKLYPGYELETTIDNYMKP